MDMMTMMMGVMPQVPLAGSLTAAGTLAASVPAGQPGDGIMFAQLLGSSMQTIQPVVLNGDQLPSMDPSVVLGVAQAQMAGVKLAVVQLPEAQPAVDSIFPVKEGQSDLNIAEIKVLLESLRTLDSAHATATSGNSAALKTDDNAAALLGQLQSMLEQTGLLTPMVKEQMQLLLKPAIKIEEEADVQISEEIDTRSGEQNASEMLGSILAAVEASLRKTEMDAAEPKGEVGQSPLLEAVAPAMEKVKVDGRTLEVELKAVGKELTASETAQNASVKVDTTDSLYPDRKEGLEAADQRRPVEDLMKHDSETVSQAVTAIRKTAQPALSVANPNPANSDLQSRENAELILAKGSDRPLMAQLSNSAEVQLKASQSGKQTVMHEVAEVKTTALETGKGTITSAAVRANDAMPEKEQAGAEEKGENPSRQNRMDSAQIEVVVKEEAPSAEPKEIVTTKLEPVVSDRQLAVRVEPIQETSLKGQTERVEAERPLTESLSREQIVRQVREKLADQRIPSDNGQINIRLHPAELGELKISVRMEDQRLRVEIVAENRTVKDALMENVGSLKEALAKQNLDMKQFDVSTGNRQFFNQGFREGRQEQQIASSRNTPWFTGRVENTTDSVKASWKPRDNALLDMMM